MNAQVPTHVEGHVAGLMCKYGFEAAKLFINMASRCGLWLNGLEIQMTNCFMKYGDAGLGATEEEFSDFSAFEERLIAVGASHREMLGIPFGIDLYRPGVGVLSIGVGDEEWMLFFHPDNGDKTMGSLGDSKRDGASIFYFGDHSLMSNKYLILRKEAIQAVREWFESGALSPKIKWTDVVF